jgi:FAD/FMN-containing dehydrogenase
VDLVGLERALRAEVDAEVRFDVGSRGAYATGGSNDRQVPLGVDGLLAVDREEQSCVVEPGIVLDELNRQLADHRLMFGPKPSTHSHCAFGGMVGNNSCGALHPGEDGAPGLGLTLRHDVLERHRRAGT